MFGGIPQSFFDTYHKYFPKTDPIDEYEMRINLYELYHYLNHTALFGVRLPVTSPCYKLKQKSGRVCEECDEQDGRVTGGFGMSRVICACLHFSFSTK